MYLSNSQSRDLDWLDEILNLPDPDAYELREYGSHGIHTTRVAFGAWPTPGVHWVATLGARRIFLMVSDLDVDRVGDFLAHLVHLDRRDVSLELELSLRYRHPLLTRNGWEAVCFLDPEEIPNYPGPDVDNLTDRMLWTLPITRAEHEARSRDGVCAMFERIAKSGRDMLHLRRSQPAWP